MTSPMSPAERAAALTEPLSKTAREEIMKQHKKPLTNWWAQDAATNWVAYWRNIAARYEATLRAAEARAEKAEAERDMALERLRPGSLTERAPTQWAYYNQACRVLYEHEATIASFNAEIAALKCRLAEADAVIRRVETASCVHEFTDTEAEERWANESLARSRHLKDVKP